MSHPPPPSGVSLQETQKYIFNNIISFLLLFIICQIFTPINLMSMHNLISYGYINAQSNKLWIHWSKVWLYSILLYTEGDIELTHILRWLHITTYLVCVMYTSFSFLFFPFRIQLESNGECTIHSQYSKRVATN